MCSNHSTKPLPKKIINFLSIHHTVIKLMKFSNKQCLLIHMEWWTCSGLFITTECIQLQPRKKPAENATPKDIKSLFCNLLVMDMVPVALEGNLLGTPLNLLLKLDKQESARVGKRNLSSKFSWENTNFYIKHCWETFKEMLSLLVFTIASEVVVSMGCEPYIMQI